MIIKIEERIKAKAVFWDKMKSLDCLFNEGTIVDCQAADVNIALNSLFDALQGIK